MKDIGVAMMTTRRPDGRLVSRAMAPQKRAPGAHLWFMTRGDTEKVEELEEEPQVNLAYYDQKSREWVSVSGLAHVTTDRSTIERLWSGDWEAWLPKDGDPRHGTPDDPRIRLIGVEVQSAVYFEADKPRPVLLYEVLKAKLTGRPPDVGELGRVSPTRQ